MGPKKSDSQSTRRKSPRKSPPEENSVDDCFGLSIPQIEHLINIIEQHPCLYNSSLREYKDKGVIAEAWTTISSNFPTVSIKEIQLKWKNLRTRYLRSRKMENSTPPSGSGSKSKSCNVKWIFHDQMSFLNRHIKERIRITNLQNFQPDMQLMNNNEEQSCRPEDVVEIALQDIPLADDSFIPNEEDIFDVHQFSEADRLDFTKDRLDAAEHNEEPLDETTKNDNDTHSLGSKKDEIQSLSGTDDSDGFNMCVPEKQTVPQKKRTYGFEDVLQNVPSQKKRKNSSKVKDDPLDSVVSELSALTSAISNKVANSQNKQIPETKSVALKSFAEIEWEEYALNFGKRVAAIQDEKSRDLIRREMENLYIEYKHLHVE